MNLASPRIVNIKDLRDLARRRLPDAVFDYLDGAADDEVTLKDSERAYQEVIFKPRFAVATPECDLGVTVLGHKLELPFLLGPIGYSRLMHPRGELAASKAAGRNGTAYILSTMSGHRIEDVKAVALSVLRHRIVTNFTAEAEGIKPEGIIEELLKSVPTE